MFHLKTPLNVLKEITGNHLFKTHFFQNSLSSIVEDLEQQCEDLQALHLTEAQVRVQITLA
jgi:hypothetical protein